MSTEAKSFVTEMLEEELKRKTKSKNKIELQLARTKNNIRKHQQNLRKMRQRLREIIDKIREEEMILDGVVCERDFLQVMLKEENPLQAPSFHIVLEFYDEQHIYFYCLSLELTNPL